MDSPGKIEFFVPGIARPGGSKRGFYVQKLKRVVMTPANKKTKPWMDTVRWYAMKAWNRRPLLEGAIQCNMTFLILRPKSHRKKSGGLTKSAPRYPTPRPDTTKLVRSTEDALTGVIWRNDSQVVVQHNKKVYVDSNPGVRIVVTPLPDDPPCEGTLP